MDHAVFISHNFAGDLGAEPRSRALRRSKQRSPPLGWLDPWPDRYSDFVSLLRNARSLSFWWTSRRPAPASSTLRALACAGRGGIPRRSFAPHARHSAEVLAYLLGRLPFVVALDRGNRSTGFESQTDQERLAATRLECHTCRRLSFCQISARRRMAG